MVTTDDLKFEGGNVSVVHRGMPLLRLHENQSICFVAHVTKGDGKMHAKWSPCGRVIMKETDGAYTLRLEGTGQFSAKEVYLRALERLSDKLR